MKVQWRKKKTEKKVVSISASLTRTHALKLFLEYRNQKPTQVPSICQIIFFPIMHNCTITGIVLQCTRIGSITWLYILVSQDILSSIMWYFSPWLDEYFQFLTFYSGLYLGSAVGWKLVISWVLILLISKNKLLSNEKKDNYPISGNLVLFFFI